MLLSGKSTLLATIVGEAVLQQGTCCVHARRIGYLPQVYADVCWRMLAYAGVCWRMLAYADVCMCRVHARRMRYLQVAWVKNGSVIDKITSYYSISSVLILLYIRARTTIYVS
jgi:ABC-type uncharacterized transport system ATPase component